MFEVDYYRDEKGTCAVKEFVDGLSPKLRAKVFGSFQLLEEFGTALGMPYSRHLGDGLFELRCSQGGNAVRVIYFFVHGQRVILTHGFVKKTQRTPR